MSAWIRQSASLAAAMAVFAAQLGLCSRLCACQDVAAAAAESQQHFHSAMPQEMAEPTPADHHHHEADRNVHAQVPPDAAARHVTAAERCCCGNAVAAPSTAPTATRIAADRSDGSTPDVTLSSAPTLSADLGSSVKQRPRASSASPPLPSPSFALRI